MVEYKLLSYDGVTLTEPMAKLPLGDASRDLWPLGFTTADTHIALVGGLRGKAYIRDMERDTPPTEMALLQPFEFVIEVNERYLIGMASLAAYLEFCRRYVMHQESSL